MADIIDNCREIVDHNPELANRFLREGKALLKRMHKGHMELHIEAITTVNNGLDRLSQNK